MGRLGDDFVRLVLDLAEKDALDLRRLEDIGRRLDAVEQSGARTRGWSTPGSSDPFFRFLRAQDGAFVNLPIESARIGTNTGQTISNDSLTVLAPADTVGKLSGASYTHGLKVNTTSGWIETGGGFSSQSVFLLYGVAHFASNATGIRRMEFRNADTGSTVIQLYDEAAHPSDTTKMHGMFMTRTISALSGTPLAKHELAVYQNSGGDLACIQWRMGAIRIH